MLKEDVLSHFGSSVEVASVLHISPQAVSQWGERIPPLRAAQIAQITLGKLRFDPDAYRGYWQRGHAA